MGQQLPMTTRQAFKSFKCKIERSCSLDCKACWGRVWFLGVGDASDIPASFDCPYCGNRCSDPLKKQ
jgi:hypothetical protein